MNDGPDNFADVHAQQVPAVLHLGPVPQASARARGYVRDRLQALGLEALTESAELGVSELVTNACLHARTAISVSVRTLAPGVVRIEVSDDSPRRPAEQRLDPLTTTGRGIRLLSAYGSWGIDEPIDGRTGKTVWFQPVDLESASAHLTLEDWAVE